MSKRDRHRAKIIHRRNRAYEMKGVFDRHPKVELSDRTYVVSPAGPWVRV